MRTNHIILLGVLSLVGCDSKIVERDGSTNTDLTCQMRDMAQTPPAPKCAAAKGLAGDNLLCVDFSTITMPFAQSLPMWSFSKDSMTKDCWEVQNNRLQIINFSGMFQDTCRVTLPTYNFNDADKQKYKTVTLALVQQVDLDLGTTFPNQLEQIYNASPPFLLSQTSGNQPEQQFVLIIDLMKLPAASSKVANFTIQVMSAAKQFKNGLQISSIAVNASQ